MSHFIVAKRSSGKTAFTPDYYSFQPVEADDYRYAAEQIALELSMGGYYRVTLVESAASPRYFQVAPVTTYSAVEIQEEDIKHD